ncbi:MAG: hypothetical protein K6C94_06295 [Candidatus Gastranaerophilales bacterium]|nr:hypothetical protein [Candidatus Gastranaerophilales bacterium]
MKNFIKITFCILLLSVIAVYLGIVYVLPSVINSRTSINKLQALILDKTGTETNITGLNLKISPKFNVVLKVDGIDAKKDKVSVANIEKLSLQGKLLQKELTSVSAENIFLDGNYLKQFKKEKKKEKKGNFELKNLPEVHLKKFVFKSDEATVTAENTDIDNNSINLKATINSPYLKEPLKLGNSGSLQFAANELKANKYEITIGNSHLYLDGLLFDENKNPDFDIKGENLPVSELTPMVLHIQKLKDPSKKFIENFKDFTGTVRVNLKVKKDGIFGTCVANNFGAKSVLYDIPSSFKETVFNFRGNTIDSVSEGVLANEKVTNTLNVTNLTTPEIEVIGVAKTTLTPKFKSVPDLTILNNVNVNVVYKIKSKKPEVFCNINIPAQSDLIYNSFYLGLRDYKRKMFVHTFKDGNDLYLREYQYSYSDNKKENTILAGDGLLKKNVDKKNRDLFVPQYIAIHTNGYAPISVTGSFGEKVQGGEFKGDLNYDFVHNQVLGTFDIINARHRDFQIEKAHITSQNGIFNITANGLYKGEKYSAELSTKNNIFGETIIYNMRLFLDKLILETSSEPKPQNKKINTEEISKNVKNADITINKWEIIINEIIRDKFILQNVNLIGSLKNHIFNFSMKEMNFADGTINADGFYDFAKNISKMTFEAENINSNKVAEMTLNLKDQIDGIAKAKVDIDAKDMFKFLDAHCIFEVKEGYMPKLGDTEFMIDNVKYKLSEITNFDLSQKDLMKDDIKGTFDVHNTEIKNINLTTWNELSAMFLEGSYEMEKQYADLQLFWHYSKEAPKGIRIFGIPLNLILKVIFRPENSKEIYKSQLAKIPAISADEKNSRYYRIMLKGDINNNKTTLELKEIR